MYLSRGEGDKKTGRAAEIPFVMRIFIKSTRYPCLIGHSAFLAKMQQKGLRLTWGNAGLHSWTFWDLINYQFALIPNSDRREIIVIVLMCVVSQCGWSKKSLTVAIISISINWIFQTR